MNIFSLTILMSSTKHAYRTQNIMAIALWRMEIQAIV